jgi:hypothetical protein
MPRKGSPAASASGHGSIRTFFTPSTGSIGVSNSITTNSVPPAAHAAAAAANPESNQIRTAGDSARGSAGGSAGGSARGSAGGVQRQSLRAEEEGEDVNYSGTCSCIVYASSTH